MSSQNSLHTERCVLYELKEDDYSDVMRLYKDENVRRFLGGTIDEDSFKSKFTGMLKSDPKAIYWTIRLKETREFVGLISLDSYHNGIDREVSYQTLPQYWKKGIAREVLVQVLSFAFQQLHLNEVYAETQTANTQSKKLLESVGMILKTTLYRFDAEQAVYVKYRSSASD